MKSAYRHLAISLLGMALIQTLPALADQLPEHPAAQDPGVWTASSGSAPVFAPVNEQDTVLAKKGAEIFARTCASCHDHPQGRVPPSSSLGFRSPESIVGVLTTGPMKPMTQAANLSVEDIRALATHLTGRQPGTGPKPKPNLCTTHGAPVRIGPDDWPDLAHDIDNSGYQARPGITAADLPRLKLKWAYAYGGGIGSEPIVAGGRVFTSTGTGDVVALDADTGCTRWTYATDNSIRRVSVGASVSHPDQPMVFVGDTKGYVYAIDASNGTLRWKTRVEDHILTRLTASPVLAGDRLFVPISSMEDPLTHDPDYACCTFRGGVAAIDANSGKLLWKTHTIAQAPRLTGRKSEHGQPLSSPAGASIWTPLVADMKRGVVYAATGESYNMANPAGAYSIMAFDMKTGAVRWQQSTLPPARVRDAECKARGEDTDCRNIFGYGSPPLLATASNGRQYVIAGQKYGVVYALDPDRKGRIVWHNKVSYGGDVGGVMYGMASAGDEIVVPIGDVDARPGMNPGAVVKLNLVDGKELWRTPAPAPECSWGTRGCHAAQSASVALLPDFAFVGSWDGHLRAYDRSSGKILWQTDTAGKFPAVNGVVAEGGAVSGYAQAVVNGALYVTSGAASQRRPGNALLVYTEDGK
ncbi:MAG: PQQ-binding-like beta-propeller repeat protein [Proteobacteria bacterium]|nr:PQQ-binding-like beta-propeller repeat protein [Pseudomonadota bacterium]HQR04644.1 PQQ-binding-like beta-propeller repeat protein [Rhodocyclaceae bacterium]